MKEYSPTMFAERLRELREARNWTQRQLADKIGCRPSTVNNWEHDYPNITIANLVRVADALGVSIEELAGLA